MANSPVEHSDARIITAFTALREHEFVDLPLYHRIATICVEHPSLFRALHHSQPGQARPVLWLAAIHEILLAGSTHPLAEWYPSVTDNARDPLDDAFEPTLAEFVAAHDDELTATCATRTTQTNEVNRSAWWMMLLRHPMLASTREVSIVELGASAGLNLCFDEYSLAVTSDTGTFATGPATSPVTLHTEMRGHTSIAWNTDAPRIVERAGIDAAPIHHDDAEQLRWLQACIWPDQHARSQRFAAAVDIVGATRPSIVRGDAIDDLPSLCDGIDASRPLIIFNSWVLTYIERSRRQSIWDCLDGIGANRELWWWSLEAPGSIEGIDTPPGTSDSGGTSLGAVTHWNRGSRRTEVIARMHPHLQWFEPLPNTMG